MVTEDKQKVLVLPETMMQEDYDVGLLILRLASLQGWSIYLQQYKGKLDVLSGECEKLAQGMLLGLGDSKSKINITEKKAAIEQGRTMFRALQIKGLFESEKLTPSLKKNHYFFGNNIGEMTNGKKPIKVTYMGHDLVGLIQEKDLKETILRILITLCRNSYTLLDEEIKDSIFKEYIMNFSSFVYNYCKKSVSVLTNKGRKNRNETKEVIPRFPRAYASLLKGEYSLISKVTNSLFTNPQFTETQEKWVAQIRESGWTEVTSEISRIYSRRAEFLTNYSNLTTKRLSAIRKLEKTNESKRKRDITEQHVMSLLRTRDDRVNTFIDEIISLDKTFSTFLAKYRVNVKREPVEIGDNSYHEGTSYLVLREYLTSEIRSLDDYKTITAEEIKSKAESKEVLAKMKETILNIPDDEDDGFDDIFKPQSKLLPAKKAEIPVSGNKPNSMSSGSKKPRTTKNLPELKVESQPGLDFM
jgi:hypothetical protein